MDVQPYLHLNRGGGDWHAPSYGAAYSPDPIMFRQTQYKANRTGIMAKATTSFMVGGVSNQFEVGAHLHVGPLEAKLSACGAQIERIKGN